MPVGCGEKKGGMDLEADWHALLSSNGQVKIWDYETGTDVKAFEVTDVPVRCVRYIARKNWFVSGSDDFQLRVYNISTGEKITQFEAHPDYIRCLTVHPTLSLVLTGSDDMTIKCWDWDKGWRCVQVGFLFNPSSVGAKKLNLREDL